MSSTFYDHPVLNSPYEEPARHHALDDEGQPSGSAGTGKTVVALHRAAKLLKDDPNAKILLTTFSSPLANVLARKLRMLIGAELAAHATVLPFDGVARELFTLAFGHDPRPARPEHMTAAIKDAAEDLGTNEFTDRFLLSEWTHVVDAWQIDGLEAYRDVPRLGRKSRMGSKQRERVWPTLPSEWLDHVPARPDDPQHFLTSDNCVGCHGGLGGAPSGNTMFLQTGPNYGDGYDISEYGEWRWSPMGLAGRDPIFFAQLESEFALLKEAGAGNLTSNLGTTCLSCHGAMGQRQLQIDAHTNPGKGLDPNEFKVTYTLLHNPLTKEEKAKQEADGTYAYHEYGNLAREGISCAVCHHIAPPKRANGQPHYNELDTYLMNGTTGVFRMNQSDQLIGPFDDVRRKPMENAMGIRPVFDAYVKDSQLCGACHTINLPNVDADPNKPLPGYNKADQKVFNKAAANGAAFLKSEYGVTYLEPLKPFQHSVEQATYTEWANSIYAEEDTAQSCQDCHMKNNFESVDGGVKVDAITTQIASIQDSNLPAVTNLLPTKEVEVPFREGYKRHSFVGLNAFMVEMLSQFRNEMGLSRTSPMTYATNGARLSVDTMALQARNETADLALSLHEDGGALVAHVDVTNKTGHRFPSGVGFRRAFVEVKAVGADGSVLWCSGCSNEAGVILGPDGKPLKTEFLDHVPDGAKEALYQPHHRVIDAQDQVQIYEELTQNAQKEFTTSFIHRVHHPKDNRLTPHGTLKPGTEAFRVKFGDSEVSAAFMKATLPEGRAATDPDFQPGSDRTTYRITLPDGYKAKDVTVTATLYYQAIPPYYLKQRFETAPTGPATQRLYYLASRLRTEGTLVEGWKLKLRSDEARLD